MGTTASQITSLTIVYWTVYSGADQRKQQSSASLAFVTGEFPAQRASNVENAPIWWRYYDVEILWSMFTSGKRFIMVLLCYGLYLVCVYKSQSTQCMTNKYNWNYDLRNICPFFKPRCIGPCCAHHVFVIGYVRILCGVSFLRVKKDRLGLQFATKYIYYLAHNYSTGTLLRRELSPSVELLQYT